MRLGQGTNGNIRKPQLVKFPRKEVIVQNSFGVCFGMALNNKGEVYAWGTNKWGCLGLDIDNRNHV